MADTAINPCPEPVLARPEWRGHVDGRPARPGTTTRAVSIIVGELFLVSPAAAIGFTWLGT
jgi:hypothetical protein